MIKSGIRERYGRELADRAVKKGQLEYQRLVENAPGLGKGNPMASNVYFAYVFVGAWLRTEKELSPDDMALIMTDVLTKVKWFFGMTDLNRTPDKWYRYMKKYEKWYDAGKGGQNGYNLDFIDDTYGGIFPDAVCGGGPGAG